MSPVEEAVAALLRALGFAPEGDLAETPRRVAHLFATNLLSGRNQDPAEILRDRLPNRGSAVITLTGLPFHGVCPHHLLPYHGVVHLAYDPGALIVGLGRLERLLECLSRRLVLQEDLTQNLVDALMVHLDARGAACAVEAEHLCLSLQGHEPRGARLCTRAFIGTLEGRFDVLPPVDYAAARG